MLNDTLAGQPILVVYDEGGHMGLAYDPVVEGRVLEFYNGASDGLELRDRQTDSLWDSQARAVSGPLAGTTLEFVPSFISEWYGWSGYHPDTLLFEAGAVVGD